VFIKIDGRLVYLWRAVDAEGELLDVLMQSKRDNRTALKLMRKLLKKMRFVPDKFVTDDLRSYGAAARNLRPCPWRFRKSTHKWISPGNFVRDCPDLDVPSSHRIAGALGLQDAIFGGRSYGPPGPMAKPRSLSALNGTDRRRHRYSVRG
jgi:DDE domain